MRTRCALCLLVLMNVQPAWAQQLPSYLNSNETERNLPAPNLPIDAYRAPAPATQLPDQPATQQQSQQQMLLMSSRVTVRNVQIEGGTVYPFEELAKVYEGMVGRPTSLAELIEATRGITQRYQADGYLLSYAFLPPQRFENGRVRVVLVEGYVKDYELRGELGGVSAYVRQLLDKIQGERPLTRKTFERYTTLLSRVPGVTLSAQVPPPEATDGASRLVAQAQRKAWTSNLGLTESSRDDIQALLSFNSNSHTAQAEQLGFSVLVPPGEEKERYYRLDYSQYIGSEGTQLSFFGSHYRSEPSTPVRLSDGIELQRKRDNDRLSIGISHPWIAAPDHWFSTGARLYAVNDETRYDVVGLPLSIEDETDIRVFGLEADWRQSSSERLRILSGGLYQGIDGLGARTDNGLYDLDFFRMRISGLQSDQYSPRWQGVMSAALYWSDDNLPDAEQTVFGGQNFARGYPNDQATGDKGWGAAYELNYSIGVEGDWIRLVQPYTVVDAARTWFNEQPVSAAELSSLALGLRFGDARYYNIAVEVAKPMSDEALDSRNRSPRLTLSFSYQL